MNLKNTTIFNGIAVTLKIVVGLLINKTIALLGGPSGFVVAGQLQNFLTILTAIGTGGILRGVTKYSADKDFDEGNVLKTSIILGFGLSIIISIMLIIFSCEISNYIFGSDSEKYLINITSVSIIFISLNSILLAYINGIGQIKTYVYCGLIGNLLSIAFVGVLSFSFGLRGSLTALVSYQVVYLLATLFFARNILSITRIFNFNSFDREIVSRLSVFSMMAITTAAVVPLSSMMIRNHLVSSFGIEWAGNWDAMIRISKAYLAFFSLTMSVYFLPKFSKTDNSLEIKKEISEGHKLLLPISILGSLTLFLLKDQVVRVLYSDDFVLIYDLFKYQVIGDIFKVSGLFYSFLIISKARSKFYIFTEVIFSSLLFLLCSILSNWIGYEGVAVGYMLTNFIYWLVLLLYCKHYMGV
jgi:PST family polysaccharide transporter